MSCLRQIRLWRKKLKIKVKLYNKNIQLIFNSFPDFFHGSLEFTYWLAKLINSQIELRASLNLNISKLYLIFFQVSLIFSSTSSISFIFSIFTFLASAKTRL